MEKSECVSGEIFEVFGQAAATMKPRKGAFDNPTSRHKLKPFGLIGAFDDFDLKVRQDFGRSLLKDRALISGALWEWVIGRVFALKPWRPHRKRGLIASMRLACGSASRLPQ